MKNRVNSILLLFLLLICQSCGRGNGWGWTVDRDNGLLLWTEARDSCISYHWDGGVFDKVAHGMGVLYVYDAGQLVNVDTTTAYYGAVHSQGVCSLEDGSKFVGRVEDGLLEGFGVYVKDDDLYVGIFSESKPDGHLNWYKKGKLHYTGEWKGGIFQGEGTLYKEDGSVKKGTWQGGKLIQTYCKARTADGFYEGYVLDGKPDGIGRMLYNDSSRYEGGWSNGKWRGEGVYCTKTDTLSGYFEEGNLNGTGICKTKDFLYDGDWFDNKPDGIGYAVASDSSFYSGGWADGKRNGYGDMRFSNGDFYSGDWTDNLFDGIGTYTYARNGDSYYGEWKDGWQNGLGTYKANDFEYTGNWEDGWINGEGRITYANADFYEGNFVENERYGVGYYQFNNGNSYEGEFVDGQFNGLGVFRFADGNVYEGEFRDGKIKGDGTLYYLEGKDTIAITANWDGSNRFPKQASVLFGNGDLYEGELVNGFPTGNGIWTTAEEREKGESGLSDSANRANEFYKRHKDTWNKIVNYTSVALTVVEVAAPIAGTVLVATGVGAPLGGALIVAGKVAGGVNFALNVADAAIATTSASIDVYNAVQSGDDSSIALKTLGTEVATNAAFIVAPKALKKLPIRRAKVLLSASAKGVRNAANKSLVVLEKNETFGKMIKIVRDKTGALQKSVSNSSTAQMTKNIASSIKKKFESAYLASLLPKTLIYKELQVIKAKGAIKLKKKELDYLLHNADKANLKAFIQTYTGNKNNYLEFFIRLAEGDKKQVAQILDQPQIKEYIDKAIRTASGEAGYHEWLMTKNFRSFLLDEKWGDDGAFLAIAQSRLIQKTRNVNFKGGGGHPSSGRPNSSESAIFHSGLAEVIDKCNTKEELLVNIRAYAKKVLAEESYKEFNEIFKSVLQTMVK